MAKIILNQPGSPVQISVKKGVSKAGNDFRQLKIVVGDYEPSDPIWLSKIEVKEIERVLAEGADAVLGED